MLPPDSPKLADVLISNTHTDVSIISPEQYSACQLFIHPNSGYDNLPADFIAKASFPVVIGNPIRAHAVANYILGALFSHYSPIVFEESWNQTRKWPRTLISELNILILGNGHIGSILKESLTPLAASVVVFDPEQGVGTLELENIDVLIPACSLNQKNIHLINKTFLEKLKNNFLLINAARGQLVNTADLLSVLEKQKSAFAILDVFEKEPADFSLFKNIPNLKVTSHIAGVYQKIHEVTASFEAQVIADFCQLDDSAFHKKYQNIILKNRLTLSGFLI